MISRVVPGQESGNFFSSVQSDSFLKARAILNYQHSLQKATWRLRSMVDVGSGFDEVDKKISNSRTLLLTALRIFKVLLLGILSSIRTLAQSPADEIWNKLALGNSRFVSGKSEPRNLLVRRKDLAKTQHPRVAVLSCSDSRVPPELVFDASLGDLFVVRSAGESADALVLGSLEYAVEHLGTVVIVVMGHQSWRRGERGLLG